MKPTLPRLGALILTLCVGVAIPQLFPRHRSIESFSPVPSSGVASVVSPQCYGSNYVMKGEQLVIAVANDGEFYFGQRRIELSEVRKAASRVSRNDPQIVFIKSAAHVRFETVSLVADQIRAAGVTCIEFRLDKKKPAVK
jgi:biopolymer transport protein ExbD